MKEEKIINNEENNAEQPKKENKKKFSLFSIILILIGILAVVVFLLFVFSSNTNFNEVKNGNEPSNYKDTKEYTKDGKKIKYYYYTIYKIEIVESKGEIVYTLKPIFLKDY